MSLITLRDLSNSPVEIDSEEQAQEIYTNLLTALDEKDRSIADYHDTLQSLQNADESDKRAGVKEAMALENTNWANHENRIRAFDRTVDLVVAGQLGIGQAENVAARALAFLNG